MGYDEEQTQIIGIIILTVSLLSTLAIIFTIYCYFKYDHLHNAQFKLVTRILFSDLIYEMIMAIVCIFYFIFPNSQPLSINYPVICQLQAFLSNYSILSSTAWTSIICHTLYNQVLKNECTLYYLQYICIGYCIPAFISYIPFYVQGYGIAYPMPQTNCFYNSNLPNYEFHLYITLCYYLPIWIAFVYNFIVMAVIFQKIKSHVKDIATNKSLLGLFIYPSVLAVCWVIPGIISQLDVNSFAWDIIAQLFCNLVGFLDALCYCFTEIFSKLEFKNWKLVLKIELENQTRLNQISDIATVYQNSQQL